MQMQPSKKVVGIEHRTGLRPLTEEEIRFEIDMCIGCDRCMRACPVPMSSLVNIADLNRGYHFRRYRPTCRAFYRRMRDVRIVRARLPGR